MGVLAKRTGEPIGSFEELAARADNAACKRENKRDADERAAINLMTLYDLPTLEGMLAISEKRSEWVSAAGLISLAAAYLLLLFWSAFTQDAPPVLYWVAVGAFVACACLLFRLHFIQFDREQLIRSAIRMHLDDGEGADDD